MALFSSLLLLAAAQPSAADPLPSEIHNFGDWVVTCDNGFRCEAVSLVPENPPTEEGQPRAEGEPWDRFGVMRLERGPEADAPLVITITDFEGTPARLVLYSDALDARIVAMDEEGAWRVDPANRNAFLDNLYSGILLVQDASGRTIGEIALTGSWGAMIYMDERQGRLRTPTALLRRGRRPVSAIPAPPPLPVVQVAPRTTERPLAISPARIAEARRSFGCSQADVGGEERHETAALGDGRTLIMMTCGSGAYNFSSLPLIAWREGNGIRIEPASFDVWHEPIEGEDERPGYHVTNAEFDPATMSISEWAKGRGLGDCGVAATYAWDGQRFRLVERNEMSECRGTLELLTTWRAEKR